MCGQENGNNIRIPAIFDTFFDCSVVNQPEAYFEPNDDAKKNGESEKKYIIMEMFIIRYLIITRDEEEEWLIFQLMMYWI